MNIAIKNIDVQKVGFFRFKKLDSEYLLTNDVGDYCFLKPAYFNALISGKLEQIEKSSQQKYQELVDKDFVNSNRLDLDKLANKYRIRNVFLNEGPVLHIIVVTLRCNHKCVYCQSNASGLNAGELDMDISVAKRVVDRIFESPGSNITIEFQGGEPLINFKAVKFIVEYAQEKNKEKKRNLNITMVSNLTCLTPEIMEFLTKNDVDICTSLDGPEFIHNKNRISVAKNKNSYKKTVKGLKIIKEKLSKANFKHRPNALLTLTKHSLPYHKEIVDEYIKLGLDSIHLRPMNTFSLLKKVPQDLRYTWADFVVFYKKALDYIIELNLRNIFFYERTALLFLVKILTDFDPNYLDIRSPCGAGIGQMAYDYNGNVYTCDEGRMLSRIGDEAFRLGNVMNNSYAEMISCPTVKAMCVASCLDNLPGCSQCAYKPYCGICPLLNYAEGGSIFIQQSKNERCLMQSAILDYLFEKLKDKNHKKIFEKWVNSMMLEKQ